MTTGALSQWVIYKQPRDYPGQYVLRRWLADADGPRPTGEVALADSLEAIRAALPGGLTCIGRYADDDPCIVEVWL